MKKFLTVLLSLTLAFSCLAILGCKKNKGPNIYKVYLGMSFVLNQDDTLSVYKLTDTNAKTINIPASVDSKIVTSININAFKDSTKMQKVIIPYTIEKIGGSAFENCGALSTVEIKTKTEGTQILGVKEIGSSAFKNSAITSIDLSSVTSLKDNALENCVNLTQVTCGNQLKHVGRYAFSNCVNLQEIELTATSMIIENFAFYNCSLLKKATFTSVNTFGLGVLQGCNALKELFVAKMGQGTNNHLGYFFGGVNYNQNQIYVPTSLEKLTVVNTTSFTQNSLYGINSIKELTLISESSLSENLFRHCTNLQVLSIPSLYQESEEDSKYLKFYELFGDSTASVPTSLKGVIIGKDNYICDNAFSNISTLTSVSAPLVNKIGKNAFSGCSGLQILTTKSGEWKTTLQTDFTSGTVAELTVQNITADLADYYWYI